MIPNDLKRTDEWNSKDIVLCVAHDQISDRVWLGTSDFGVYEFLRSGEKPERKVFTGGGHTSYVTGVVQVDNSLVSCSYDGRLCWWDAAERKLVRRMNAHASWIRSIVASPDGSKLFTVADDMLCKVWDAQSGELLATLQDHAEQTPHHYPSMLYAIAASPDGRWLATGDRIGHVAVWDAESFEKASEVETPIMYTWDPRARRHSTGGIRSLAFSPDGSRLAVGGVGRIGNIDHLDGPARLEVFDWSTSTRQLELEDKKKKGLIEQIVWSPNEKWILTAGGDNSGFITIYDAESGELLHQDSQNAHIHALAHDDQFQNIYVASHEKLTRWTMAKAESQ